MVWKASCRSRRSILPVAVSVSVIITTMSACAGEGVKPVNTMSPREGRDQVVELVVETSRRLNIEGWWPRNGVAAPDVCSLDGGGEGASYSYEHWAPQGTEFDEDARKVAAYWQSLGMSVRVTDSTSRPTVYAEGGSVLRASFMTSTTDNSYRIGAVARCAPGDAARLLDEDNAQREAGVLLPGDEGVVEKPSARRKIMPTPQATPE